ncbi:magnesium transporter CorA family protein [Patescibacteria group bacterium]|nr:magnesium transporter CorA family protein [Patescibacteria group bacterium]
MKTITSNNITWINIKDPKENNLEELKEKFNLHPFIAKQFLPPIHRPKIEEHPGQVFIVLHFPIYDTETKQINLTELDFIVTENTLITSHNKIIPDLETFFNDCDLQDYHKNQHFKSSGHLLFGILDWLIDSCLPMLDNIGEKIEDIEKQVFEGKEKEMLMEIAMAKKDLIDFRRAIKPQRSILEILGKKSIRIFGEKIRSLSQEVIGSVIRVWNILENHRELITSIEQTNNSLLSHKLSDIMKFLTVVSFITFPLSVIVGFFGMNIFGNIPALQSPSTWLIILILMFIITGIMVMYFKKKKWL